MLSSIFINVDILFSVFIFFQLNKLSRYADIANKMALKTVA